MKRGYRTSIVVSRAPAGERLSSTIRAENAIAVRFGTAVAFRLPYFAATSFG